MCKKLLDEFQNENKIITNDSYELQKFCSKLEFLLQFKLKEKKSLLSSNSNKDYWNVFVNLLSQSRTFEDAIKYVKNLNEVSYNRSFNFKDIYYFFVDQDEFRKGTRFYQILFTISSFS